MRGVYGRRPIWHILVMGSSPLARGLRGYPLQVMKKFTDHPRLRGVYP